MEKLGLASLSWSDYALAGATVVVLGKAVLYLSSPTLHLPPSPPADPLIGHARIIPLTQPYKTYAEWGKKYGMLLFLSLNSSMLTLA